MRKILFFFSISLFGFQNPICRFTNFQPAAQPGQLKTISISFGPYGNGVEHCTLWFNSPSAGQIQSACYIPNNPIPIHNSIDTPASAIGFPGGWNFQDGQMNWIIKAGEFHLAGAGSDGIAIELDGTF